MTIKDLHEGDIFKLGNSVWDAPHRFIRIGYYDDKKSIWVDSPNKNTRSCVFLSDTYSGKNRGGFAWWNETSEVFIPTFPTSPFKKSIGKSVVLQPNGHLFYVFPYQLNYINKQ